MDMIINASIIHGSSISRHDDDTTYESYRRSSKRLDIETEVCHKLDGDALKDALFIVDNIRENKMKIRWSSGNTWSVKYRYRQVCDLKIERDSFIIGPVNDVLITRVKNKSRNQESVEQLIEALKNSMPCVEQKAPFYV